MAITGITTTNGQGHIDGIWLDAVISELYSLQSEVTEHPVEEGVDVADHIRPRPREVRLECRVTNTPIRLPRSHADGSAEVDVYIETAPREIASFGIGLGPLSANLSLLEAQSAVVRGFSPGFDRVASVYAELLAIRDARKVVTIRTTLEDLPNMAITEITITRSDAVTKALWFTLTAKQIATASSRTVQAPRPVEPRAKRKATAGRQAAESTETDTASTAGDQAQSILSRELGVF